MIQKIKISELSPNNGQIEGLPTNPRLINEEKFQKLKKSLRDDPEMLELRELLVFRWGEEYVIIGGNMRFRAAVDLGIEVLPCKIIPPETPIEKLKAYVMKDNIAYGEYDWDLVANEWDAEDLEDWGLDVWQDKGGEENESNSSYDNEYTKKIEVPIYEPTKEKQPPISALFDKSKYDTLISEINASNVSDENKKLLVVAASRHIVFNYSEMAEYYAHAEKDVQSLMENSALVIIDYDKAIENGYVKIKQDIKEINSEDYDDE